MLIVTGQIEMSPEHVEEFKARAITMMAATNAEDGCDIYGLYQDLSHPGQFRLYEEWQSQEALMAHLQLPHTTDFLTYMRAIPGVKSDVKKVTGGTAGSLR